VIFLHETMNNGWGMSVFLIMGLNWVQEIFLFSSALKVKILSKKLEELEALLSKLKEWCKILREVFSSILFICGPKNNKKTMQIHVLLHFFVRQKWQSGYHAKVNSVVWGQLIHKCFHFKGFCVNFKGSNKIKVKGEICLLSPGQRSRDFNYT